MKPVLSFIAWLMAFNLTVAQVDSLHALSHSQVTYGVEIGGLAASSTRTPFWLQANQYGIIPQDNPAGLARLSINGRLGSDRPHRYLSYGVEAVGIAGRSSSLVLSQAYASLDRGHFSLWGGRRKEIIGLGDSTLSSGFYSWSGNALPITKIQIGTNGFTPLKFTKNLVWVHAFYAHGWFANSDSIQGSFLHQKALYVRIGRPGWKVRFTGGVLHSAQWGGYSSLLPSKVAVNGQLPQSFKDYLYVVTAAQPDELESATHTAFDGINRFGNHLGSIDFGMEMTLGRWQALGYYQHPFEDKSGVAFINFPDGLYGLRFKRQPNGLVHGFQLQHVTFEYFNTMDQSGPASSTGKHYDGRDDYFNNYQYINGWTMRNRVIGNPFLTPRESLKPELQNAKPNYSSVSQWAVANNRIQLFHVGLAGVISQAVRFQARLSYSHNYGTYRTPFDEPVSQFSGSVWLIWPVSWLGGSELRTAVAVDQGQLYSNTVGGWLSIRKTWKAGR